MKKPDDRIWRNTLAASGALCAGDAFYSGIQDDRVWMFSLIGLSALYFHMAICRHDGVMSFPIFFKSR